MKSTKRSCLLVVQGEGRGHMTQALSVSQVLSEAGIMVSAVMVGSSTRRKIPAFFYEQIKAPVEKYQSPNFVTDSRGKSVKIMKTLISSFKHLPVYRKSLRFIGEMIRKHKPDFIINFYEPLAGLYYLLNKPSVPMISIGHQYLAHHPSFEFPKGHLADRLSLKIYTALTSYGSSRKLALSFYPLNDIPEKKIYVIPPLLRKEIFMQEIKNENYLLVYLLNAGYAEDIIRWHKQNPGIAIHCFTDREQQEETVEEHPGFFFHRLNDKIFLHYMAGCKGLVTTAGFESVCEAMYLGKPVFMVPVDGHFEQHCNAVDAYKAGAGIYDTRYRLDKFMHFLPYFSTAADSFRSWTEQTREKILFHVAEALSSGKAEPGKASKPVINIDPIFTKNL